MYFKLIRYREGISRPMPWIGVQQVATSIANQHTVKGSEGGVCDCEVHTHCIVHVDIESLIDKRIR